MRIIRFLSVGLVLCAMLCLRMEAVGQTVSGTVSDAATGETLIGATVMDLRSGKGTVTNAQGRYTLTMKTDTADLRVSFIGYGTQVHKVALKGGVQLNVRLESSVELDEVTVSAERVSRVAVSQMSAIEVPVEQIKLVPVIFGETDVLKAIQLLPGVQSGTEGTSGIYVRGGGPDENLFLLDGVPLYNVNHLGGFFSAFNSDAIKNVTLYKGSFPARFSGRISSVLDIATNNGNDKEWHGGVSVGAIAAKVNVEGPIVKERTTMSVSFRRTYFDLLMQPMVKMATLAEGVQNASLGYYFYDLNAKVTHRFSDRSRLYASVYSGDDEAYMGLKESYGLLNDEYMKVKFGYKWGNLLTALRWNYELTPKLFMNITGSYTRYRQNISMNVVERTAGYTAMNEMEMQLGVGSGIGDLSLRADFDYAPTPEHAVKFGGGMTHHRFQPRTSSMHMSMTDEGKVDTTFGEQRLSAQEVSVYVEDDWSITDALKVNGGFVVSGFMVEDKSYFSPQPRLSGRLMLSDDVSIKAGYSYMTQYMHLLSTTNISLPTDLWVPVTARILPMSSHQVAAGVFYNWRSLIDFSVEGYYKWMNNMLEYKPGSTFLGSTVGWEEMVNMGRGWAYGVEFLAQKSVGKITGWVGYTLSRTMRQFDRVGEEINGGKPFPAKYDRIHDVSITLQYRPNEQFDCGVTWVYCSGNMASLALQRIDNDASLIETYSDGLEIVSSRNNFRLPAYHRMDISVNFHKQKKHGMRTWSISVYNVYNRQNPFFIYPHTTSKPDGQGGQISTTVLMQRSMFPIIPSVSYLYKF